MVQGEFEGSRKETLKQTLTGSRKIMDINKFNSKASIFFIFSLMLIATAFLAGCGDAEKETSKSLAAVSVEYPIMGTMAEIILYGNPESAKSAADAIQNEFSAVENTCSRFDSGSELSKLNESAALKPFKCSDLLWDVLVESKRFYELTGGSFDITATPLMELWGFYRKRNSLPSPEEISEAKNHVGLNKVIFDTVNHTLKFSEPGIKLDLGGIAKGYAIDLAAAAAIRKGINCGTINLGGNIRCMQNPPPGKTKYTIGVRDPFNKSDINGTLQVIDTSIATSGNYEKYVTIDGVKYTHIMDPETARPVQGMIAVTVVTPKGVDSDALSTSIFIKGEAFARKACSEIKGTSVLIIKDNPSNPQKSDTIKIGNIWE
jgi:thiamine biosynthesis lipoprotein